MEVATSSKSSVLESESDVDRELVEITPGTVTVRDLYTGETEVLDGIDTVTMTVGSAARLATNNVSTVWPKSSFPWDTT